jgi:uncharacterized protein YjbJ (UPF0337 family)
MADNTKSDQARKGLIDSVKGKAKEIAGAVTGNDSLTAEGQLEQTQAQERKEANSVEAVADAEAAQARAEAAEARQEGVAERVSVNAEAAAAKQTVDAQNAAEKSQAEQAGQRDAAVAKTQAELDAQREIQEAKANERNEVRTAAGDFVDAVDDHQADVQEADSLQAEADRARQRADSLTNDADLT